MVKKKPRNFFTDTMYIMTKETTKVETPKKVGKKKKQTSPLQLLILAKGRAVMSKDTNKVNEIQTQIDKLKNKKQ